MWYTLKNFQPSAMCFISNLSNGTSNLSFLLLKSCKLCNKKNHLLLALMNVIKNVGGLIDISLQIHLFLRTSPIMNVVGFQVWTQYYWHHHNFPTLLPFLKDQKIIKTTYNCTSTSTYKVASISKRQCFQRIIHFVYLYCYYF